MSTALAPAVPPDQDRNLDIAPRRLSLTTFAWAQVVLLAWWAGVWPGLISPDSRRYVIHVTTGPWTADHSVLYDSLVLASLKVSGNLALLTLLQTTAAAALLSYASTVLRQAGVPTKWAVLPAFVLPFVPSFGASIVTVWKDVPFAYVEVMVALTTLKIVLESGRRQRRFVVPPRLIWSLCAELSLLCLFRNDGFLMLIVVVAGLLIGLRGARRQILTITAVALVVFAGAQRVVYPALGIKPADSSLAYGVFYGDIALAYAQHPGDFTAQDRALLARVAPLSTWAASDNCFTSDPLFTSRFNRSKADAVRNRLAGLWFRSLARAPVSLTLGRLCRGAIAWSPLPPPGGTRFGGLVTRTRADLYDGIKQGISPKLIKKLRYQPLIAPLGQFLQYVRGGSADVVWQVLMMRGSVWCYLTYLAVFLAWLRLRRWEILLVALMPLANQLTVTAANPAQLYRYMMGPIFVGMILLPLVTLKRWNAAPPLGEHSHNVATGPLGAPSN